MARKYRWLREGARQGEILGRDELTDAIARYPIRERKCLLCSTEFQSTGPHHRMCPRCATASRDFTGV